MSFFLTFTYNAQLLTICTLNQVNTFLCIDLQMAVLVWLLFAYTLLYFQISKNIHMSQLCYLFKAMWLIRCY